MTRRLPRPEAEQLLWRALDEALPRARFARGIPVGPYVAGFLSRPAALVVELDDGHPGDAADAARTRFLNGQGLRLIRFWDEDVLFDVAAVLDTIACALPPELLADAAPRCRIGGAAARAEWSPRPDFPAEPADDPAPQLGRDHLSAGVK
jgi:very-short-patch-repair endonuclease